MKSIQEKLEEIEDLTLKLLVFDVLKPDCVNKESTSIRGAINYGFTWKKTPQGDGFWRTLFLFDITKPLNKDVTYEDFINSYKNEKSNTKTQHVSWTVCNGDKW